MLLLTFDTHFLVLDRIKQEFKKYMKLCIIAKIILVPFVFISQLTTYTSIALLESVWN